MKFVLKLVCLDGVINCMQESRLGEGTEMERQATGSTTLQRVVLKQFNSPDEGRGW
jgi:hypothetical protein